MIIINDGLVWRCGKLRDSNFVSRQIQPVGISIADIGDNPSCVSATPLSAVRRTALLESMIHDNRCRGPRARIGWTRSRIGGPGAVGLDCKSGARRGIAAAGLLDVESRAWNELHMRTCVSSTRAGRGYSDDSAPPAPRTRRVFAEWNLTPRPT